MEPLRPQIAALVQVGLLHFLRLAVPAIFGALWVVLFLVLDAAILWLAEHLLGGGEQPELMRTMSTWAALAFYGLYLVGEFWRSVRAF
jgi:hypothetical protein